MSELTKQELHNLAINHVGKDLEQRGFEFLAINSKIKSNPQFVCVNAKNEKIFVVIRAIEYPNNPNDYDVIWMESFKMHAQKHQAQILYAGVGIANANNPELPVNTETDFILNYHGIQKIE
jgi:hypothetical protein